MISKKQTGTKILSISWNETPVLVADEATNAFRCRNFLIVAKHNERTNKDVFETHTSHCIVVGCVSYVEVVAVVLLSTIVIINNWFYKTNNCILKWKNTHKHIQILNDPTNENNIFVCVRDFVRLCMYFLFEMITADTDSKFLTFRNEGVCTYPRMSVCPSVRVLFTKIWSNINQKTIFAEHSSYINI